MFCERDLADYLEQLKVPLVRVSTKLNTSGDASPEIDADVNKKILEAIGANVARNIRDLELSGFPADQNMPRIEGCICTLPAWNISYAATPKLSHPLFYASAYSTYKGGLGRVRVSADLPCIAVYDRLALEAAGFPPIGRVYTIRKRTALLLLLLLRNEP